MTTTDALDEQDDDGITPKMRAELDALGLREYPVKLIPIDRIHRYSNNPRRNAKAVAKVVAAIREFGWQQHLVLDPVDNVIIVGDTRYLAAIELGYPAVPCKLANDLTPEQIKAYRIADNRVHDEADWDDEKLTAELEGLLEMGADMSTTGMDDQEIKKLLNDVDEPTLTPVEVAPLPTMTWVLIGLPTPRFIEIAEDIEKISAVEGIFCELTANSDHAAAHRKAKELRK